MEEDTRWLEWVTRQFENIAGDDKEIDLDEFKTALKVKEVPTLEVLLKVLQVLLHILFSDQVEPSDLQLEAPCHQT